MKVDQIVRLFCIDDKKYKGKVLSTDRKFVTLQHERGCVFVIRLVHIVSMRFLTHESK